MFALAVAAGETACRAQDSNQQPAGTAEQPAETDRKPTFSLEAVAVNKIPVVGGATRELTVGPGDVLTLDIFLRDWSVKNEKLRAYQAAFDFVSYTSGTSGSIKPVDFDNTTAKGEENPQNAFIDDKHPKYLFQHSRNRLPIVDTITHGYRWMNVVIDPAEAIVANQDGTKFYCGTAQMKVSDDAAGTFKLKLLEDPSDSMLRDETNQNNPIGPIHFEHLKVHVVPGAGGLRVVKADPPSGAIDARRPVDRKGGPAGAWDRASLTFTNDATALKASDFEVTDGSGSPPEIRQVIPSGSTLTVVLSQPIRPGAWTTISHRASKTGVALGCLPGDVNADGVTDARDVLALIETPKTEEVPPLYQLDVDGDGSVKLADAIRIIEVLADPQNRYRPRLNK